MVTILESFSFSDALIEQALRRRELSLGAATLSCPALLKMLQHMVNLGFAHLPACMCWHAPTLTAHETQQALPPGILVQKTVSFELPDGLVMITGIGNYQILRRHRYALAAALGIHRSGCFAPLNPATVDPVAEFGMAHGMVSPFLNPNRHNRLQAVVWLKETLPDNPLCQVAISCSRYESMILPARSLPRLLKGYAEEAYPQHIRFLTLY